MSMDDLNFDENSFTGRTRLFPLPNHVMFPHVIQPLHVFEPRYKDLVQEALGDDRLITLATLAPGWEKDYDGRPPVRPVACLCRLAAHHKQEDGRYNILLAGMKRIRLTREFAAHQTFRVAECELLHDLEIASTKRRDQLRKRLLLHFETMLPVGSDAAAELQEFLSEAAMLGPLTDIVAHMLPIELAVKEKLLAETAVESRAEILLEQLPVSKGTEKGPSLGRRNFPPDFSVN